MSDTRNCQLQDLRSISPDITICINYSVVIRTGKTSKVCTDFHGRVTTIINKVILIPILYIYKLLVSNTNFDFLRVCPDKIV